MTPDELISRIGAALDETERIAQAADVGRWEVGPAFSALDNRVYVRREGDLIDSVGTCVIAGQVSNVPRWRGNAGHIAHHDPAAVLRRVKHDWEILDAHIQWQNGFIYTDPTTRVPDMRCSVCHDRDGVDYDRQPYPVKWPCPTVRALARGLGINPEQE